MQKLKLITLISITITVLSGCSKSETPAEPVAPTSAVPAEPQKIAKKSPEGDIYAMAYKLCGKVCEKESSVIMTWGRPTEVGIAYFSDHLNQTGSKLISSINDERSVGTYFVVKSKGSLPGQEQPIPVERFVPTEKYPLIYFKVSEVDGKKKPIHGHIEIMQIKKIDRTPGDDAARLAITSLKARLHDRFIVKPDEVAGYLDLTKDKPDIVPQQVEPITWKEGQAPQVIPVKSW